jgi:hypothetical protein
MSVQSEFEKYLKQSDYFADVINTHRTATAEVIGAFVSIMIDNNQISQASVLSTLKALEESTGHISLDSERRHLAATLRELLKGKK